MEGFSRKIDRAALWLERLTASVLIGLALLIVYDAFMRYIFSEGSIMLQELEWHLFDLIILFSVSITLKYNQHVRVDIFYHHFSQQRKALITLLGHLFMVIPFSLLIIIVGFDFVAMSYSQMEGSADPGGIPFRFVIKGVMIVGFLLLLLQSLSEIARYFSQSDAS